MSPTNTAIVPRCNCPFHIRAEFRGRLSYMDKVQEWGVWRETYSPVVSGMVIEYRHFVGVRNKEGSHTYVVACTSILAPESKNEAA